LVLAFALTMGAALARHGAPLWLCLPALITVCFSYLPTLFPWRPSVGQLSWLPWVQLAELGGEPLLDLLWSLAGTSAYETLRRPSRRLVPALVAAVSVAGPAAYGAYRLPQVEAARSVASPLPIGVVQPNIGIEEKHDRRLARSHLHQLRELTASLERRGAELVVWPETAYPYPLDRQRDRQPRGPRRIIGRKVRGPVLTGALTVGGPCERWNSAVVVDRRGAIAGVTDKVRLLAFGEYVPLWHALPPLRERFPCPGLLPGNRPTALEAAGERIGVLNCYEDILGSLARQVMLDRPTVLVNVTNDAWFGDSSEPHIHQLLARMRAIETRRDLVRAVNTGVSSHVSATGAEVERTPTFTDASFVADARPLDMRTPWVRLGDWTSPTLVALLIATALACRPRRRRWA
jgi:apolipoprotein N-acyltransferase